MKVKIVDSTFIPFGGKSISAGGDNISKEPQYFQWDGTDGHSPLKFFTDIRLSEAKGDTAKRKVALLLEPPAVSSMAYDTINPTDFDIVLTYDKALLEQGRPYLFYPFGGSWINRLSWGVSQKERLISMIVGSKKSATGHTLRHRIAGKLNGADIWGEPYTEYIKSKRVMLEPYMYSIIVENDRRDYWFTEKLIDCISLGTVPIYWGCPSIRLFFNETGILSFETEDELKDILGFIGEEDYRSRLPALHENLMYAEQYYCTEDYIYTKYPTIFDTGP